MGQRHQLFVIAKIAGRYRALAALHHQWLYGAKAVSCCHRLLQVFRAPENRIPIQQELLRARTRSEAFWTRSWGQLNESTYGERVAPFPFISSALILGASFDHAKGLHDRVHPLEFNLPFDGGDNNDGVTVIDITNQARLRYCFVCFEETKRAMPHEKDDNSDLDGDLDSEPGFDLYAPLSARSYLRIYYLPQDQDETLLQSMEDCLLIDVETLDNVWPRDSWKKPGVEDAEGEQEVLHGKEPIGPLPLKSAALDRIMQSALDNSLDFQGTDFGAVQIPDFRRQLRLRFYEICERAGTRPWNGPQSLCELIYIAFEEEDYVDLSRFRSFSSVALCQVIAQLQEAGRMKALNISNLAQITAADLEKVLNIPTNLRTLYAMETPQIPLKSIVSLINQPSNNIRTVYHTELFRKALEVIPKGRTDLVEISESTDFAETNAIAHLILVQVMPYSLPRIPDDRARGYVDWSRVKSTKNWDRSNLEFNCAVCTLDDIPLPIIRWFRGLLNYLEFLTSSDRWIDSCAAGASAAAKSFAVASHTLDQAETSSFPIGPLPAALWSSVNLSAQALGAPWPTELPTLKPGQWSLLLIHENVISKQKYEDDQITKQRLRYALISQEEEGEANGLLPKFRVIDMETFLKGVAKHSGEDDLLRFWNREGAPLTEGIGVQEVQELMPHIEEHLQGTRTFRPYDFKL